MPDYPSFIQPKQYGYGVENVDNGQALLQGIQSRMNQGLPEDVKQRYYNQILKAINGNTTAGRNAINQQFANSGLSSTSKLGAVNDLYSSANNDLIAGNENILNKDYEAQQNNYNQGINNEFQLLGLGANIGQNKNSNALQLAGQQNNYNQSQFQYEDQNKFSFGKLLGGIAGLGGGFFGSILGLPSTGSNNSRARKGWQP